MNTPTVSRPDLWKQYEIQVDLYKHYLKLALEVNVFYYAITGAIVSYYFAHRAESSVQYALLLPIIMSAMFSFLFIWGGQLNRVSREEMFRVRDALSLQTAPEFEVLTWLLRIFAVLMLTVAATLSALLLGSLKIA